MKLHTFLLGVMQLFGAGGHFISGATVNNHRRFRAEPLGGADGVHRHVAAADHGHAFAEQHRRVRARELIRGHQVDAREVFVG